MALEKEDIMALIAILQKGLTDEESDVEYEEPKKQKKSRGRPKKSSKKEQKLNKFDSMPEKNMHKQDTIIDKKLWGDNKPTERTRSFQTVSVRCRICGKAEDVNPSLIDSVERYKCNKCATVSG
jgi:hypothetical protein